MGSWRATSDPVGRTAIDEIEGDAPLVPARDLEQLASAAHALVPETGSVVALARACGCRVVLVDDLPGELDALLTPMGVIYVRRRRDRARMTIALLHEIAHWILRDTGHSHGDVWTLCLALLLSREQAAAAATRGLLTEAGLRALGYTAPAWAIGARLAMLARRRAA